MRCDLTKGLGGTISICELRQANTGLYYINTGTYQSSETQERCLPLTIAFTAIFCVARTLSERFLIRKKVLREQQPRTAAIGRSLPSRRIIRNHMLIPIMIPHDHTHHITLLHKTPTFKVWHSTCLHDLVQKVQYSRRKKNPLFSVKRGKKGLSVFWLI